MDVNLLTAAQTLSSNQPKFDQEAFDRAVLRDEKRRESALKFWTTLHAQVQKFSHFRVFITGMATSRRLS